MGTVLTMDTHHPVPLASRGALCGSKPLRSPPAERPRLLAEHLRMKYRFGFDAHLLWLQVRRGRQNSKRFRDFSLAVRSTA